MLHFLILFNVLAGLQVLASDGLKPPPDAFAYALQQAQQLQKDSTKFMDKSSTANIFGNIYSHKSCSTQNSRDGNNAKKKCIKSITPQLSEKDKTNQILVFISFSMPELSLKSLFQEAHLHNAVLVMRGLYQDSFVKTAQKLQELGVTIDINPGLFESHNITSVPTFVLLKNNHPTHLLKGNVTLEFAAKKFKDQQLKGSQPEELQLKEKVT